MLTHAIVRKYGPPTLFNQWEFNYRRNHVELHNNNDMYIPRAVTDYVILQLYTQLHWRISGRNVRGFSRP
jgi:hypothetical protein